MNKHKGIKGLEGREPIGACVTIGRKDKARGFPTDTDRWWITNPREESGTRHLHPGFAVFNELPTEKRKVIRGNIVHATQDECFEHHLKAQVISKPAHPDKRPMCTGNGVKATRWVGPGPDDFMEIKCLGPRCEYSQGKPSPCKPFARLLFRLRWPDGNPLSTPVVKFTTGAWSTTANLVGFFDQIKKAAHQLGIKDYTLFGLPFLLTLQYQTKPSANSRFPVVYASPEMDPVSFFMQQRANIAQLQHEEIIALPDMTVVEDFEDVQSISVPSAGDK